MQASQAQIQTDDRFEIRGQLGSGSFGTVYEAFDRYRERPVALKVLDRVAPDTVARFKREFRSLAEIRHPNLVSMYELVCIGDRWSLSMELVRGVELLEHLAMTELQESFFDADRLPTLCDIDDATLNLKRTSSKGGPQLSAFYLEQVRDGFRQLAIAISVLHAQGVVHRDVKPSNVMITGEGRVLLLDFGLAMEIAADDTLDRHTVVGTPGYMSPEQFRGARACTPASDWYSAGVILYQALTGQLPFTGPNALGVMESQVRGVSPWPDELVADVPEDLASLARDLIQPDPAKRPGGDEILRRFGVDPIEISATDRAHPRPAGIVDRDRELKVLMQAVTGRETPLVALHGAAGIGKTAVADRLLDRVRTETNALVLGGRCRAWESVPFNAIDAIVESLTRHLRRNRTSEVDDILRRSAALIQLFPELDMDSYIASGDVVINVPASGRKLIARATSELRSVLLTVADQRPLVILLDDAQWGDYQSGTMFRRLLESPNVTLVVSYRSEDWRTGLLLQSLFAAEIERRDVELRPFTKRMTEVLLEQRLGRVSPRVAADAHRDAKGNPMLIEMIAEHVAEGGPARLRAAVEGRLRRLSAAACGLFSLLVSSDHPLEEEEVRSLLELFEVDEPLRSLTRAGLIRSRRTGDLHELDVYHPRIREVWTV